MPDIDHPRGKPLNVKQIAEFYGCKQEKVLHLIETQQLRAIDLKRKEDGERPRWIVYMADLLAFEERRASAPAPQPAPAPAPQPAPRRRTTNAGAYARY